MLSGPRRQRSPHAGNQSRKSNPNHNTWLFGEARMTALRSCAGCGAQLLADVPGDLCPRCQPPQAAAPRERAEPAAVGLMTTPFQNPAVVPAPAELARHFPQLEILELIGRGGMGVVYKARQPRLDRLTALKILAPAISRDPAFAERFAREARALARLSHANIVSVYDFGDSEGLFYFLMEFVDGTSLRQTIRSGRPRTQDALRLVMQACEALRYAHEEGVVHRDIKPENILLDRKGRVKLADFGLARVLSDAHFDVRLTGTHQIMGTLHYMAPEQVEQPLAVDHRADLYSLGVVLYEILTSELPLGRFPLPTQKAALDARLDAGVLSALEKEPQRRYQHAGELAADLQNILNAALPVTVPTARATEPARVVEVVPIADIPVEAVPPVPSHRGGWLIAATT